MPQKVTDVRLSSTFVILMDGEVVLYLGGNYTEVVDQAGVVP